MGFDYNNPTFPEMGLANERVEIERHGKVYIITIMVYFFL